MKVHGHHDEGHQAPGPGDGRSAKDLVCGMQVDPDHSAASYEYKGTTYHFCSIRCHDQFKADPQQFLGRADAASVAKELAQPETAATQENEYTCPMHPEMRQDHPGRVRNAGWRWNL